MTICDPLDVVGPDYGSLAAEEPYHTTMHSYTSLPEASVRLLRLLPSPNQNSRIECQLITFSMLGSGGTHPYEALSYVWGSEDNKQPIYIDGNAILVTANLHVALSHLRHCFLERIIWVDAICINQDDNAEKERQVRSMAEIYAKASRVIVWLGEASDNGDQALEAIRMAAQEQHTNSAINEPNPQATSAQNLIKSSNEVNQQAILRLLQRPWFQRIWVLQEVAAARQILIKCGSAEIDGHAFCSGINALKPCQNDPELNSLVRSVAYLITGANFRFRHENGPTGRFSLGIRPLSELVDMYHDRKATDHRDKVYALLGMSSDAPDAAGLSANYETETLWKDVFQKLIRFYLPDLVSVNTWNEVAVMEAKGCVLGEVTSASEDDTRNDRQLLEITWKHAPSRSDKNGKQSSHFAFQYSAKPIKKGDIVCFLQGASTPTIVRLCDGFFTIIMITVPRTNDLLKWAALMATFPTNFLLVWDWDASQKPQGGKDYGNFIRDRGVPKCPVTECECQNHLDGAIRWWNLGMLLNGMERYAEAVKYLRNAVEIYGTGAALRSVDSAYPGHQSWKSASERALGMMEELLINDGGATIETAYKEHGYVPLLWAAKEGCETLIELLIKSGANVESKDKDGRTALFLAVASEHEAIVKLLLATGRVNVNSKDQNGQTPLSGAAENGREAVVKLLLATGKIDVDSKDDYGRTPLLYAAENGHEAAVELLLATGKVDVNSKDQNGQTPLSWTAKYGHEAVVKLLLATGKIDVNSKDKQQRTPLSWAAKNGHEAVVKLLLATGKIDVNSKDQNGETPLSWAAENGHEAVVKLLLATGKIDVDSKDDYGQTPLSWAAKYGHEAVVKLLLATGKIDVDSKGGYGQTPLSWAAENGHEAVVKLLLATGKVDVNSKDQNGETPLSWAAKNGHEAAVELLLATSKVNVNSKDEQERTPLSWAAENGHEAVVELLLAISKVDANSKDKQQRTPLSWAAKNGHEAVVELLRGHAAVA